jgi:hypothetical protein
MTPEEIRRPPLKSLLAHCELYGPEGIMESAAHLSEAELVTLDKACRAARKATRYPKRRNGKGRR